MNDLIVALGGVVSASVLALFVGAYLTHRSTT